MRPYLPPLIRSLAAPMGRMVTSHAHGVVAPELYIDQEGMNDRGNPYAFGSQRQGVPPHGYNPLGGQLYGAIPAVHNHDAYGAPLEPRRAYGTAFVTPQYLWNLSGVASGWSRPGGAHVGRPVAAKMATGRMGALLAAGGPRPVPPLPTLPEPARMIAPRF